MKERKDKKDKRKKKSFLRFLGWGAFFPALAEAGIGILFLALPENSMHILAFSVGALFALLGVVLLSAVFLANAGIFCLAGGAAFVGFSVWLFVQPDGAVTALLYTLIAMLFLRALLGMWNAFSRKKEGTARWEIQFFACLTVAVADFVLFFAPFSFFVRRIVLGVLYLTESLLGLSAALLRLRSHGKKQGDQKPAEEQAGGGEEQKKCAEGAAPKKRKCLFGRKKER